MQRNAWRHLSPLCRRTTQSPIHSIYCHTSGAVPPTLVWYLHNSLWLQPGDGKFFRVTLSTLTPIKTCRWQDDALTFCGRRQSAHYPTCHRCCMPRRTLQSSSSALHQRLKQTSFEFRAFWLPVSRTLATHLTKRLLINLHSRAINAPSNRPLWKLGLRIL